MNPPADGPRRTSTALFERASVVLLVLAGVAVTGLVIWCIALRLPYPHEFSKMEGGFVDHALWSAAGRPIYAKPSSEFASFLYMPLAHVFGGWLVRLGLDGYVATRLVALAGIAGAIAIGMTLVARATGRRALALLVPALVCARYFDVECFFDQARPDNLMACFCMLAVAALALPSGRAAVALFVVSGLLAFFTKQTSALFLGVLLVVAAWVRWRVALAAGALLFVMAAPLFWWLDARSGGWFHQYTWTIAATHTLDWKGFRTLLMSEVLNHFALATACVAVAAIALLRTRPLRTCTLDRAALTRHLLLGAALGALAFVLVSSTSRLAVRNVFVIDAIVAAAFVPVALDSLVRRLSTTPRTRALACGGVALLLAADLARGARNPWAPGAGRWVPEAADVATWQQMIDACDRLGPRERTWFMLHGAPWGGHAGDPFLVHFGALTDLIGGYYGQPTGVEIPDDLLAKIAARWYTAIVVGDWDFRARALLEADYERSTEIAPIRLPMFSGNGTRPSEVWVPKRSP